VPDRERADDDSDRNGRAIDLGEVLCVGPVTHAAAAAGQAAQP
jgi:hypothetical protein